MLIHQDYVNVLTALRHGNVYSGAVLVVEAVEMKPKVEYQKVTLTCGEKSDYFYVNEYDSLSYIVEMLIKANRIVMPPLS